MTAGMPLWAVLLSAAITGGLVTGILNLAAKRTELRAGAPKGAAEVESIGRQADSQTIVQLTGENRRLYEQIQRLETRLAAAEAREDAAEAREHLLVEAMHRWTVWAAQVTETAARSDLTLPPAPRSPIQTPSPSPSSSEEKS